MLVEVQDVGQVDFPDDAKPDEITAVLNKRFPKPSAAPAPRFDTSKIKLDPYQETYLQTGLTDPSRQPFADYAAAHPRPTDVLAAKLAPLATTPEKQAQLGRVVGERLTPELPVGSVVGDFLRGATVPPGLYGAREEKQKADAAKRQAETQYNEALAKLPPDQAEKWGLKPIVHGKVEELAVGGVKGAADLAMFFASPAGIATLGLGAFPKLVQRGISLAFAGQMASQLPAVAGGLMEEIGKPDSQRDYRKIGELVTSGAASALFATVAAAHGLSPAKPGPFQGPLATGEILQRPAGAVPEPPPDLGPIPGVPARGIPAPRLPEPGRTLPRPTVPETPAEPRETSVETIRHAQAKTKEQIQKLFPQAELSREQAAKLRDLAWGKPTEPQPTTPTPYAIHKETEEILRTVQQPGKPEEGARQMPAVAGGPPTGTRGGPIPGAPPGQVPLTPTEPTPEQFTKPEEAFASKGVTRPSISARYFHAAGDVVQNPEWWVNMFRRLTRNDFYPQETAYQIGLYLRQLGDPKAGPVLDALEKARTQISQIGTGALDKFRSAKTAEEKNQIGATTEFKMAGMAQFPREAIEAARNLGSSVGMVPESAAPPLAPAPTAMIADTASHPIVEVPLSEISLSPDIPNFKGDADPATGVVPGQELGGKYQRVGTAPIVLWERLNGKKEVITGRHRLDLARRTGEKTIPAQIMREADGYTLAEALTFDAESNIREGQGSIEDYAHYFKNSPEITETVARAGGLLSRAKGKAGFDLGKNAADDLYSLWSAEKIATEEAVAIARAAPGNADLQVLGIKQAFKGRSPDEIENFIKAVQTQTGSAPEQVDLFGRDDSAIKQAEEMAARASEQQKEIAEQVRAVQGAAKRPELAKKLGVDVRDPEGVIKRIGELKADLDRWQNWSLHPDLVAQVGGKPPPAAPAETSGLLDFAKSKLPQSVADKITSESQVESFRPQFEKETAAAPGPAGPAAPGELFPAADEPFNLTGEKAKFVEPKTEQTSFGGETLTQNELFGIQEVVKEVDPEKSANAAEKLAGDNPAKAAAMLRRQVAIMQADPQSYKSYGKVQKARLNEVIALLDQRADGAGAGKVLGFGGAASRAPGPVPLASTPQQLATLIKTKTPGLATATAVKQGIQSLLLPTAKSPAHLRAAEKLGARLGAMNRRAEATAYGLRGVSKFFDRLGVHNEKLPPGQNPGIKFMSDVSQGRPLTGRFQAAASQIKKLFQERLDKLETAGAALQSVRDNYFPGMWTRESRLAFNAAMEEAEKQGIIGKNFDANAATPAQKAWIKASVDKFLEAGTGSDKDMLSYFTRRPLKGQESFRKQKVFDDIMTGAELGLRPISNNPIDLVKWKLAEMDRSIMANEYFRQLKADGEMEVISPYKQTPDGWVRLPDKYGTIYGPPTVTIPEHIDKAVYEGLLAFAGKLGIRHERSMKFPSGPGSRALGLSYQSQDLVRTRFATETSVLAHEIGHQLNYRYDFWKTFVTDAVGLGKKGVQTKAASQKQRGLVKKELRNIADLTGNRGGDPREREEQIAQMVEAYVHAPEEMRKVAPTVFKVFDSFIRNKPELKGMADIKPGIELEKLTSEKYVGLPIKGYRIVPKATGDIVNNYLSSSLYNSPGLGTIYKAWMGTANALNQSQLGMGSAFHAGFTTGDVQVSAGANLIKDVYGVLRGNRSAADLANTFKTFTVSTVKTSMTGDAVLNAWRHPDGVIDPRIAQVVKATELAGGGFKMEHGLMTEQTAKTLRDWYSGQRLRAAARSPIALTELMAKPIMEFLVPRQKAGVFAEMAWRIIEQNPGKPLEELTPQFRQAWNRVDARLGQVRYNRLFINNAAKNFVQGAVRAPGWSGGTVAELGGAFPDAAKFFQEWIKTGKAPENIPDRVAYTVSLMATIGTINAILSYAFTGQAPTGMDYLAFRTGRKDKDGNDERFLLPSYVKDIIAYAKQPWTTVGHKSHPLISVVTDVVRNRDFYGYEIRNPNAPAAAQAGQVSKYVIKSFEPFWTRGVRKTAEAGVNPARVAAPYVGIMPAPAYITRSSIQNQISELYHKRTGERTKPYEARETDVAKRAAHDASTMDIYMFKRLPQSDKDALAKKMTPAEKARYGYAGQSSATATAAGIRQTAP
jgi:hypothetical protein